jgi:DNA ligase-1
MREYLMAAQTYSDHFILGCLMSSKLDGMRAFWDGGVSRGHTDCPWSNDKGVVATGLWSRYGKVIHASNTFLDGLPEFPLDGELYLGVGKFQEVMSVCRRHQPDSRWNDIRYFVFDAPTWDQFFTTGQINNTFCKMQIDQRVCSTWKKLPKCSPPLPFNKKAEWLYHLDYDQVVPVGQKVVDSLEQVEQKLGEVLEGGGEGLMFRAPMSFWHPTRSKFLLKYKPYKDAEGVIVGYRWGEGKYRGKLGSMIIDWNGVVFDLSGFTDKEREVVYHIAAVKPGQLIPASIECLHFTRGDLVTFKYRELSVDGVPKEARYFRKP